MTTEETDRPIPDSPSNAVDSKMKSKFFKYLKAAADHCWLPCIFTYIILFVIYQYVKCSNNLRRLTPSRYSSLRNFHGPSNQFIPTYDQISDTILQTTLSDRCSLLNICILILIESHALYCHHQLLQFWDKLYARENELAQQRSLWWKWLHDIVRKECPANMSDIDPKCIVAPEILFSTKISINKMKVGTLLTMSLYFLISKVIVDNIKEINAEPGKHYMTNKTINLGCLLWIYLSLIILFMVIRDLNQHLSKSRAEALKYDVSNSSLNQTCEPIQNSRKNEDAHTRCRRWFSNLSRSVRTIKKIKMKGFFAFCVPRQSESENSRRSHRHNAPAARNSSQLSSSLTETIKRKSLETIFRITRFMETMEYIVLLTVNNLMTPEDPADIGSTGPRPIKMNS